MRKIILALLAITLLMSLVGCNTEKTITVEEYQDPKNKEALKAKLKECRNNPGELANTPNCINAQKAYDLSYFGGALEKIKEMEFGF